MIAQSNGAAVGDSIYVFGGTLDTGSSQGMTSLHAVLNDVWQLNITSRVWSHTFNAFSPSPRMLGALAVVNDSVLVLFGGAILDGTLQSLKSVDFATVTNESWLYFAKERRWAQYVSSSAPTPRP